MGRITLGSASPRRAELIKRLDIEIDIKPSNIEEKVDSNLTPEENGIKIAIDKLNNLKNRFPRDKWILTADTFIELEGEILGKPRDRNDAYIMLSKMSNRSHRVLTAVALYSKDRDETLTEVDVTTVTFDNLTHEDIENYLTYDEWVDAAGAYKIQGRGETLIKGINGSFSSVMGLPIFRIYGMLKKLNFNYSGD